MKLIRFLPICLIAIIACKKENTGYDPAFRGSLQLEFDNVVGPQDLKLNTGSYTNAAGETFSVRALRYFISNIRLTNTNGSEYVVPQDSSYFNIDESLTDAMPALLIPEGEYNSITFTVGVDSLRSTMDISKRKGVLAPTVSNYMNENNGYVFFSLEGNSPQAPQNRYEFEIGGYGGKTSPTFNNIKVVTLNLSAGIAKIREGKISVIHILADIAKVFTGTENISLATDNIVNFDPLSVTIANNYALMFTHDHTHNE
jgi:hypothetical protein